MPLRIGLKVCHRGCVVEFTTKEFEASVAGGTEILSYQQTLSNKNNKKYRSITPAISSSPLTMATVLPPPNKRQRTILAEKTREQQEIDRIPENLGSIRVQFLDQATGQQTGGQVSIPIVDATVKNLELLLNTLQGNVGVSCIISGSHATRAILLLLMTLRMRLNESHTALPTSTTPPNLQRLTMRLISPQTYTNLCCDPT